MQNEVRGTVFAFTQTVRLSGAAHKAGWIVVQNSMSNGIASDQNYACLSCESM